MDNRTSTAAAATAMSLPVLIILALLAVVDAAAFIEERGESRQLLVDHIDDATS